MIDVFASVVRTEIGLTHETITHKNLCAAILANPLTETHPKDPTMVRLKFKSEYNKDDPHQFWKDIFLELAAHDSRTRLGG